MVLHTQIAPESISDNVKFKIFPGGGGGGHAPDSPRGMWALPTPTVSPLLNTFLRPCVVGSCRPSHPMTSSTTSASRYGPLQF